MKLYVCWGTVETLGGHPWRKASDALEEAGYHPQVVRSYGARLLPDALNFTPGRRQVKRLTGKVDVPALVTDDGEVVQGSEKIAEWARANPARATA